MLCHNCGGENRDDYKFCVHCGTARVPAASSGAAHYIPPPVYHSGSASKVPSNRSMPKPRGGLFKNKKLTIALIIGLILICLLALVAGGFALVKTGVIRLPGGSGTRVMIGMPNRDGEVDLYLLRLGDEIDHATLLAEDINDASVYFYQMTEAAYTSLGYYPQSYGGFVPGQKYLVLWYTDEDGEIHIATHAFSQDAPLEVFNSDGDYLGGYVTSSGNDIFITESTGDEMRCYQAAWNAEMERITKGDTCHPLRNGAYVVTSEVDNGETTLTIMDPDGENEIVILDALEDVLDFRISQDGARVAYISAEDEQQIVLVNGRDGEEITRSESAYNFQAFYFASQANILIYLSENEDGELTLYLLDDAGSLLVASGMFLNGDISADGRFIIYVVGDEHGENIVYSYNISNGQSTEITRGEGLTYSLSMDLDRVFVAQQDGDELTLYSASIDGGNVITLYDENSSYFAGITYHPDRSGLFIHTQDDNGDYSLFYSQVDREDGYFLLEEYATIEFFDLSADGSQLLVNAREDLGDDPELLILPVQPGANPILLDDNADEYAAGVYTSNGRQVVYTAVTGANSDDFEVRRVAVTGEENPETLYAEAFLVDVQWTNMQPFYNNYFEEPREGSSYCPGALNIVADSIQDGSLESGSQFCFRFRATAGEFYTFRVEAEFDTVLEMYDRDGNYLASDDDSGAGLNPRLTYSPPADGMYYVIVRSYGSGSGNYTISMAEGLSDPAFTNAVLLNDNILTRGYITSSSELYLDTYSDSTYGMMYYFDGLANQWLTIDVIANSQGSSIDSYVYLYNAMLELEIADDDNGEGYDSQIVYTLPTDGRYYILVEDLGGDFGSQSDFWFDILLTR